MNKSLSERIAWTVALLLSGVAAGAFVMDFFGYYPLLLRLPGDEAIRLHQAALDLHRSVFQVAIASAGSSCLILILFFGTSATRGLLVGSLACLVILVVYTGYALIPLNQQIAAWEINALPKDWKMQFADMIFRERLRSFLPSLAFFLALLASRR
jgi:hypothetical protein